MQLSKLPLVSLQLLRPLISELEVRDVAPEPVLAEVGLSLTDVLRDGSTAHVARVHRFVEHCAVVTKDQTFCAQVGGKLDPSGWPMIQAAMETAHTLGDFLNTYVIGASKVASSATPFLEVRGDFATFGEARRYEPQTKPSQNDAFMVSLKLAMLRLALGERLDPRKTFLVLSAPTALPGSYARFQKIAGDNSGARIRFPSRWLTHSIHQKETLSDDEIELEETNEDGFLNDFRNLILQHIFKGRLTVTEVAELVYMSPKALNTRLASSNTTISKEIVAAKIQFAKSALSSSDISVEELASALGYSDPSNFARAFAKLQGESPTKFREMCVGQDEKQR